MPDSMRQRLDDIYRELGVEGPLHADCQFAGECWREEQRPRYDGSYDLREWTRLPRPWIGPRFEELRLLCLGVNMNESGGRDECEKLVSEARKKIRKGFKKVHFDEAPAYAGTNFYYRMGAYAAEIAAANGLAGFRSDDEPNPSHSQVADVYDYLAYTNHVKCSPHNSKRSEPTDKMWQNCGRFILRRELLCLEPRIVLILGSSRNHDYFTATVVDANSFVQTRLIGSVVIGQAKIDGRGLGLVTVPHPSVFSYYCHFANLRKALRE